RNPVLPNIPTTKEGGLAEYEVSAWNALFAPKGTSQPIVDKLTDALDKALNDETTRKRLLELGSVMPEGPERGQKALADHVKKEVARWTPVLKAAQAQN
ncbi:MAG: tripartite tricarboxylate transporter substrate-binding protein, partial [Rhodoplanes sp.]